MHGRITRFKVKVEHLQEVLDRIPQIRATISTISGGVTNYVVWNEDGSGAAIAIYENAAAAEAANEQVSAIWGNLASMLSEPPTFEAYSNAENLRN